MQPERKQGNQNAVNLAVDIVIFVIFLVVEAPRFSGLPAHEWLGIAIGAGTLTHVLLHCRGLSRSQGASLVRRRRSREAITFSICFCFWRS